MTRPVPNSFRDLELRATYESQKSISVDADLDVTTRFLTSVVKGLYNYLDRNRSNPVAVESVFYLSNEPREFLSQGTAHRLFRDGLVRVESAVVFSNVNANKITVHALGKNLDELLAENETHPTLGDVPTITVVPVEHVTRLTFYPRGMASSDAVFVEYELETAASVSGEKVRDAIRRLYEATFQIPGGINSSVTAWSDAAKAMPVKHAEKFLQGHIRSSLVNAFPGVTTVEEIHTSTGRFDLALTNGSGFIGVLELKVLRKGQQPLVATLFGVNQAYAYRRAVGAEWSSLVCFDMRGGLQDDGLYDGIRDRADKLDVALESFHMYRSAADLRQDVSDRAFKAS